MDRIERLKDLIPKLKANNKIIPLKIDCLEWELKYLESEKKQLILGDVGCSNKVDYKQGFELAQKYIKESPCDPDIYKEQQEAWNKYHFWLKVNKLM